MRNPFWRLKSLPWASLLQVAGLAVLLATAAEFAAGPGVWDFNSGVWLAPLLPFLRLVMLVLPLGAGVWNWGAGESSF